MKSERECLCCKKDKLNGYKYCEDHIGRHLKNKQGEKEQLADWYADYDRSWGDGREFGY